MNLSEISYKRFSDLSETSGQVSLTTLGLGVSHLTHADAEMELQNVNAAKLAIDTMRRRLLKAELEDFELGKEAEFGDSSVTARRNTLVGTQVCSIYDVSVLLMFFGRFNMKAMMEHVLLNEPGINGLRNCLGLHERQSELRYLLTSSKAHKGI